MVTILPFTNIVVTTSFSAEGAAQFDHRDYAVNLRSVSPEYFKAMGIAILRGHAFTDHDTADAPRVAILNRELAKQTVRTPSAVG